MAFLHYNGSQAISSFRLNKFFQAEGISLMGFQNLKLYYQGMFYNLFLPGGIGGNGYKIMFFRKAVVNSTKKAFRAIVGERINGAVALGILACLFGLPNLNFNQYIEIQYAIIALSSLAIAVSGFLIRYYFKSLRKTWFTGFLLSFLIQLIQAVAALLLFKGLDLTFEASLIYIVLFFVSSLVIAIPFTLGGVGSRELTFIWASNHIAIDVKKSIAFTLLFFLINASSSILGGFLPDSTRLHNNSQVSKM
jgi:hypothetical protein